MSTFEDGWFRGYEDYARGDASAFRCVNDPARVVNTHNKTVEPDMLDYARGYMEGFERAESDSHD